MKKLLFFLFIVVAFSLEGHSQTNSFNYDVNGDGFVTVADVTAIYDYLLGNVPDEPPVNQNYVDLGLPSGTLWATMNVGANSPEEYGDYFAWGETTPKDIYDWSTYKWCNGNFKNLTKYCTDRNYGYGGFVDNKTELYPEDDAATANWGSDWRMPSGEQIQELISNCTIQWTTRNGINGCLFTSKINGALLFLPAAGFRYGSAISYMGSKGYYWSRTLGGTNTPHYSNQLYFHSEGVNRLDYFRDFGRSVRAVRVPQN